MCLACRGGGNSFGSYAKRNEHCLDGLGAFQAKGDIKVRFPQITGVALKLNGIELMLSKLSRYHD